MVVVVVVVLGEGVEEKGGGGKARGKCACLSVWLSRRVRRPLCVHCSHESIIAPPSHRMHDKSMSCAVPCGHILAVGGQTGRVGECHY